MSGRGTRQPVTLVRQRDGTYAVPAAGCLLTIWVLVLAMCAVLGIGIGAALASDYLPTAGADAAQQSVEAAKAARQRQVDKALRPHGCRVVTVRVDGGSMKSVTICD